MTAQPPAPYPIVRWIDVVCKPCTARFAREGWDVSLAGSYGDNLSCDRCRRRIEHVSGLHGGEITLRKFPDFTLEQEQLNAAIHEAGHAVVGVLTGHPLRSLDLYPENAVGTSDQGDYSIGASVDWAPYERDVQDTLAMLWAGQLAEARWQAEARLATEANALDVSMSGWNDILCARHWTDQFRLPKDAGRDRAARFLAARWADVRAVADRLTARGHLAGDDVVALLNTSPVPHK